MAASDFTSSLDPPTGLRSDMDGTSETGDMSKAAAADSARGEVSGTNSYVVEATRTHTHTFILLHGLGSNGERFGKEFLDTAKTSTGARPQQILPHVKFIFPTARRRRSTAFRRSVLSQWFDIASLSDPSFRTNVQYQGLAESAKAIRSIIEHELQDIPSSNIILGGLSQGCAMSLSVLLSLNHDLGGFVGMSGWLPLQKDIIQLVAEDGEQNDEDDPFGGQESGDEVARHPMITAADFLRDALSIDFLNSDLEHSALRTPAFLGHGEADPKISSRLGESAAQTLRSIGIDLTWKLYADQGHWFKIPDEIDDIMDFLKKKTNIVLVDT